jgi:hypothetical protein
MTLQSGHCLSLCFTLLCFIRSPSESPCFLTCIFLREIYKLWIFSLFYHDVLFTKLEKAQVCGGDIIYVLVLTLTQTHI